jgi:hypothetical protein
MGYRSRLGKVNKKEKDKFTGKSYEEVCEMLPDTCTPYFPEFHTQLYELGKYFDFTKGTTPFYDFDIEEECEAEFFIMTKEQLKELIEEYHDLVYQNYEKLAQGKGDAQSFLESRAREWCGKYLSPYYLDEEKTDGAIVSSWQYEYAIFNLVYIYRTFDWEQDYLIYSAW